MMNQLHHRAAALFEIVPSWLRFLETRRLIDTAVRVQALDELSPLADNLRRIFAAFPDDPAPLRALDAWRQDAQRAIPEKAISEVPHA
jgi:hypothetical protein